MGKPPSAQARERSDHEHKGDGSDFAKCPMFRMLPEPLQENSLKHRHMRDYLHEMPIEDIGVPTYYPKLDRSAGDLENPNLIYPVSDKVFVHIKPDPEDSKDFYIAIEPGAGEPVDHLIDEVEVRLADVVHELDVVDTDTTERSRLLLESMDKVVTVKAKRASNKDGSVAKTRSGKIILDADQMEAMRYLMVRDKEEMGPLQPLISDTNIEDISCSGVGAVFVEHKVFESLKSSITFSNTDDLDEFVIQLSEKMGKPVTFRDPIIDATLPDGSRINIVYGTDVSKRGSNFTIRKFMDTPMSILQLAGSNTLTFEMAAYLSLCIGEGMNIFVSGETASGKTTMLNALTTFIPPAGKIVSIEDTPELQVPHMNWIREVVRMSGGSTTGAAVTMFDLLKAALRQRPNEIIIGEIRGEEGAIAFQAMQTGHAAMATFLAATVEKLIQRLTGNPINVPKTYIDNLNLVLIQSAVRLPNGKTARRVLSLSEIIGYDTSSDAFSFIEMFRWKAEDDTFEFTGKNNSFLLEQNIALKRGIPPSKRRTIYDEVNKRTRILKRLYEGEVTDFYELYTVLAKANREGVFR